MKLVILIVCLVLCNAGLGFAKDEQSDEWSEFKNLFMEKRIHQLAAVKQLLSKSKKPHQQLKAVQEAMAKIKTVLTSNKLVIESSGLVSLEDRTLPADRNVREALAFVMENTCFASDFLLRFPDLVHSIFTQDGDLEVVYRWGLGFVEGLMSEDPELDIFDNGTKKLIDLSLMEMNIKEESEDYQSLRSAKGSPCQAENGICRSSP